MAPKPLTATRLAIISWPCHERLAQRPARHHPRPHPPPVAPRRLVDTRVIYCGDNLDQLGKLPDGCVDLIYIDPPFNSNRNYEVFWGETKEKRAFEDRHASTQAYIEYMRRAASNWPACSRRPAASTTTATGTPATTSR